ncbi:hypothetical protein MNBD_BACTEROID02-1923 [hydrothermal vent metagenome]|uniref:HTH tetR-type domain-containing protein n=1 Tax=hydrothermal vent metagenome TaxID=652676 RepID=A0A3B0QXI3_9ZZZZ
MPKIETFNRDLVLTQAAEVFQEKGYNATSMQDLVDATGLNRSSIYNSFVSKLDLYLDCLKSYETKFNRDTSKVLLKAQNPLHAIELIFKLYINVITVDKYDKGCLIGNCKAEMANQEKVITTFLENNQKNMLLLLEDLIVKGQEENLINTKQNPKVYALYLFSSLQGFRMTGILITDRTQLKGIANSVLQSIS